MLGYKELSAKRLGRKQAPVWLWLYAVLTVVQPLGRAVALGLSPQLLIAFGFSIVFAWLLLRGGRVMWCIALCGQVLELVEPVWGKPVWWAGIALLGLLLLLAPASRAYVWRESKLRRKERLWPWIGRRVVNWTFIGWLALFSFVTIMASGLLREMRKGSGHDSLVLSVAGGIISTLSVLALFALICLLIAAGIRALIKRFQPGT